jgi:2-enoate reductase
MLPADTVSIAVGLKSDRELYRRLSGEIANVYAIGDAQQARKIMHAIWEANEVARNI